MPEKTLNIIVHSVFALCLLGFGLAFALSGEPVFAGGLVTAALGLVGSIVRSIGAARPPKDGEK